MEEEDGEFRQWDELIPDALGLIFSHLPLQEILTVVPRVCKAWNRAVTGPYCWQEIDIELWSNRCHQSDHLDRMLQMLILRSSGSLRKLSVTGLQNDSIFSFIAQQWVISILSLYSWDLSVYRLSSLFCIYHCFWLKHLFVFLGKCWFA